MRGDFMEKVYSGDRAKDIKRVLDTIHSTARHPIGNNRFTQSHNGAPVEIADRAYVVDVPNGKLRQLVSGLTHSAETVIDSSSSNGIVELTGSRRTIGFLEKQARKNFWK